LYISVNTVSEVSQFVALALTLPAQNLNSLSLSESFSSFMLRIVWWVLYS